MTIIDISGVSNDINNRQMSADFRQTTADFELETRIRQVSQDVLKILLKKYPQNKFSHDNVFDFVKENRALLQSFDERIRNS